MPHAKYTGEEAVIDMSFGTLFYLKKFRIHGGGIGAKGVVLAVDKGTKWDDFKRPIIVAFEDCPNARYRLLPNDIEVIQQK